MNLKTRLFTYNLITVLVSIFAIFLVVTIANHRSGDFFYNIKSVTVDKNANTVAEILEFTDSAELISVNLAQYGYSLYVYKYDELIYGIPNDSLTRLIENSRHVMKLPQVERTRILFVDNSTIVMSINGDTTYFCRTGSTQTRSIYWRRR